MSLDARIADDSIAALRATMSGEVLLPGEAGFENRRRVHNGLIDRVPAVIARCQGTPDVVDALAFGRNHGLDIAVRGGGHNVAGRAVCVMVTSAPRATAWTTQWATRSPPGASPPARGAIP